MSENCIDNIIYLQASVAQNLIYRWGVTPERFVELDDEYNILKYIRAGYEAFHLTGDKGITLDIERFIKNQGGSWK